jgi:hypothetical protein
MYGVKLHCPKCGLRLHSKGTGITTMAWEADIQSCKNGHPFVVNRAKGVLVILQTSENPDKVSL